MGNLNQDNSLSVKLGPGATDGVISLNLGDLQFCNFDTTAYEKHVVFLTHETKGKKVNTSFGMKFRFQDLSSSAFDMSAADGGSALGENRSVRAKLSIQFNTALVFNVVNSAVQIEIKKLTLKADESHFDIEVIERGEGASLKVVQATRVGLIDLNAHDFSLIEKVIFDQEIVNQIHENLLIEASNRLNANLSQIEALRQAHEDRLNHLTNKIGVDDQGLLDFILQAYKQKNPQMDIWMDQAIMLAVSLNKVVRYLRDHGFLQYGEVSFFNAANLPNLHRLVFVDHDHYGEGFIEAAGALRSYIANLPGYVKPAVTNQIEFKPITVEHHGYVLAKLMGILPSEVKVL